VRGADKYVLVGELVSAAWQEAKEAGLVTDAMLQSASISSLSHPSA